MEASKTLHLWLEVSLGEDVGGRVADENGDAHVFCGWLSFFSVLDALEAHQAERSPPAPRHA